MEDIVWHDPFKKESIKETGFENNITENHSPSNSFADQFIGKKREDETFNGQYRQQTYNERYSDSYQSKRSIPDPDPGPDHGVYQQRGSAGNEEKEPVFEYHSMQDDDRKFSSGWNFLDLKNKKQTGDLYKKILYYKKKNDYSVFNFVSSRAKEGTSTIVANLINNSITR